MRVSLLLLMLAIYTGCAKDREYTRDGKAFGVTEGTFRGRWWNYYERGVSFLDGQFYEEAARDFQRALKS